MCGIVAGVSRRDIVPVMLEGLRRLEYRGYDSCGVAVVRNGKIERARSVARVFDAGDAHAREQFRLHAVGFEGRQTPEDGP